MLSETRSVANRFVYDGDDFLNYEILGNGPVAVVLVHGFGASLSTWIDICGAFPAADYTLYLVDMKGFGLSSKPQYGNYSTDGQARLVMQLMSFCSLSDVVLIGHSLGGAVALQMATAAEEQGMADLIGRLVLISPAAYPQDFPSFVSTLRTPILNRIIMHCLSARWRAKYTLKRTFYDKEKITDSLIDRYARYFTEPGAAQSFIVAARQMVPEDSEGVTRGYSTIAQPSLIIRGRYDNVIPLANCERLHADISGSCFRVIEDCGHVAQEECPQETGDAIIEFLNEENVVCSTH